jgi:hypothetical protein
MLVSLSLCRDVADHLQELRDGPLQSAFACGSMVLFIFVVGFSREAKTTTAIGSQRTALPKAMIADCISPII